MMEERDMIVITGISGRLPESNNIEEFKTKLFDGIDMITNDDRRWPAGLHGLPAKTGKLKDIAHFDASFFGVPPKQAQFMDPQMRLLLETTHEAIVDAGINPSELRGSNTGVFIGSSFNESFNYWNNDLDTIHGFGFIGTSKNMLANRISFAFDFNGPSYIIDTACSSSMLAFQQASDAINLGRCDAAVVGGTNLLLDPSTSLHFQRLEILNSDGKCKTFDSAADGYVRSEAVVVVFLQRSNRANRVYATLLGVKTNTDGYKKSGIAFPSGDMQKKLIREVYGESKVDPADVVYIEAHGTGTKAGDPQEANAIVDVFCSARRKQPLMIGSLKSNMGHSEAASGLCSLIKVIIAMESGEIPGNLHYNSPNTDIKGLFDGRLEVISRNKRWDGGIIGINSFGFGGTNVHVILRSNSKAKASLPEHQIPRLITVSGRTEDSVHYFLDKLKEKSYDEELYALVHNVHKKNITGHIYRGFGFIDSEEIQEVGKIPADKPPIWFVFSGMGSQWPGMGKALMNFEPFRKSIECSADILKPYGIDLVNIIVDGDDEILDNVLNSIISITAIQIALADMLKLLDIKPDGMIGHSVGEISCAYADNTISSDQAILLAYARGLAIIESNLPKGAMAAVGLTWEECKKRIPNNIYLACHNAADSVTISGLPESINKFVEELMSEGIFAKVINTAGVAFHCKYMDEVGQKLKSPFDVIIPNPKRRSRKWISSSIPESDWNTPLAQTSSAAYHVNNLVSPVYFYEATRCIPKNAIVIEISPHCLLQSILKRSLALSVTHIGMIRKCHPDNIKLFLTNIGRIYKSGGQPNVAALYPTISFPVSKGTPMLASMIKWDHSLEWTVPKYNGQNASRELVLNIDLSKDEYKYLTGHKIDDKIICPVAIYMAFVWRTFANLRNCHFENLPIVFEDIKLLRATIMPLEGSVKFLVNIFKITGEFQITESGSIVASGRIYTPENINNEFLHIQPKQIIYNNSSLPLNTTDVYKELNLRRYVYGANFKGIISSDDLASAGKLEWKNNWITYIDTMFQFYFLGKNTHDVNFLTGIHKMVINPKSHLELHLDQVPVYADHKSGVIISGGIEIRGVKSNIIKWPQKQETPRLEKYLFIPFENNEALSIHDALTIVTQLVFENSSEALNISVVEIATLKNSEIYILPKMIEIVNAEPLFKIEATIVSYSAINIVNSIRVVQNFSEATAAHLVILKDSLINENNEEISTAMLMLKSGGFILFEESKENLKLQLIKQHSLEIICKQATTNKVYILVRKPLEISKSPIIVQVNERNYSWVNSLKEAIHFSDCKENIYIVCMEELGGIVGLVNCLRKEPGGRNIRCFFIQDKNAEPFSFSSKYYINQLRKDLVHNVCKNGVWGTLRHLLLDTSSGNTSQSEHAYINTTRAGDLSSLKWIEGPLKFQNIDDLNINMCTVYYAPVNFRDIMFATAKLQPDEFLVNSNKQDCLLGQEFSGRDCDGRRVMGLIAAGGLASTVLTDPEYLWEVPEKWSLEEAATIPIAYGMSYYALIIRGNMQPRHSILIHSGAGVVGLASISIALHMGCKVFTTVNNQLKRYFLTSRFPQLNDGHIGYSRDNSFESMIIAQTHGRGVDLILTRTQLQTSARCLAPGGKFLELKKADQPTNASMSLSALVRNTSYHEIMLDSLFTLNNANKSDVKRLVNEGIVNGAVRPLPNSVYTEFEVEAAFRFLASGEHIGKVSIKVRDEECRKTIHPPRKTIRAIPKSHMDQKKVYILVGGLGGFGLELTNWLIDRGAKKIIISSKRGIRSGYQSFCLRRWRNKNIAIHISTTDVTCAEGAKELLKQSSFLGPIGGIFNLAVELRDSFFKNQTEEDFKIVCSAKISATKHLDAASRILTPHLDHFVVFSSASCGRGSSGQVNYGFANSGVERICENRHVVGLPALAIQWGPFANVGLVAENMPGTTELIGMGLQSIPSCLSTFDIFLRQSNPVVSCFVLPDRAKIVNIEDNITLSKVIANIMGITDPTTVSASCTLEDVGMDSLMITEIKQTLERNYNLVLGLQDIRELTFDKLFKLELKMNTHTFTKTK